MIKRIFVFSHKGFDRASANSWETDYQAITRKYREKEYGSAVPQIVFWNLRDSRAGKMPCKNESLFSQVTKKLNVALSKYGKHLEKYSNTDISELMETSTLTSGLQIK
ncbi:hypothetical protein L195_g036761 [Trifolium pratense]|uniref:DUF7788 domain-containing protein n=1 Tax=Trifolium pratense TaxID=57577 RepID=A0A2K3LQD9_TRIPR|nr:hypothetical protein L195_g036761 [Trifolium pratense]